MCTMHHGMLWNISIIVNFILIAINNTVDSYKLSIAVYSDMFEKS